MISCNTPEKSFFGAVSEVPPHPLTPLFLFFLLLFLFLVLVLFFFSPLSAALIIIMVVNSWFSVGYHLVVSDE